MQEEKKWRFNCVQQSGIGPNRLPKKYGGGGPLVSWEFPAA